MKITGNTIELDGDEVATAIAAYLAAHSISVTGPRTIMIEVDGDRRLARDCAAFVLVDPSGRVMDNRR